MPSKLDPHAGPDSRRRLIGGAAGALLLWTAPRGAGAATLLAVRLWPANEYTRLTIEYAADPAAARDAPLQYRHFLLRDGKSPRLVLDIEGVDLTGAFAAQAGRIDASDPFIARIRVGRHEARTVRLAIDLKVPVQPQLFALDPVGPYRNRLVLDLYPENAPDPLLALIERSKEQGGEPLLERAPPAQEPPAATAPAATPEPPAERNRRIVTIAIDPGHGGEDPGAIGHRGTREKDITLAISRLLAAHVEALPDHRVLLTRDSDYFVPLAARVEKARRVQADLFISVHADAWVRSEARGASVFALSERGATSSAAAELARQQNEADRIGGINLAAATPLVKRVLLDLSTTRQIGDSLDFGSAVLHELGQVNRLHRGFVEQAGFAVLKAPDIPSILVESAFLSNPEEEARLREPAYQQQVALAILHGVKQWVARNPPVTRNPVG
jgi:N-acetylmuramoyl-L-alanine amidase